MLKKIALASSIVIAAGFAAAGYANAAREYSINYEYLDDQGFTVGTGYLPCSGALIVTGQQTTNAFEVSREDCGEVSITYPGR